MKPLASVKSPASFRVGHGYDIHRLQSGGKLLLGGVVVAQGISPIAHSDGDVVLHAVVDAMLGAMGWGDIGQMFPNTDPQWKSAHSSIFVKTVCAKLRQAGWSVVNLDITILAERPRLSSKKAAMAKKIGQWVGGVVNIKAGTNEGCDAIGAGQAVAAHAVLLLSARKSTK